ncbi:MAG: peptide chain release factor N(5)-glutamine methyltransferase [Spirochaetaceae bacterium]|jgi:release factor glutamine methyltransferase|nr:peptide chain release factor N(5)-glutamine methyltransferase [Spirochaetaceae bacterium]
MTVGEVLSAGAARLKAAAPKAQENGAEALDAALLLATVLNTDRSALILRREEALSLETVRRYHRFLERRLQGECLAWLRGYKEFWGLSFAVNPDVLVPRPDTETLVEATLARIHALPRTGEFRLLDLCTGSGAVAIALKHECPPIQVCASDISPAALALARANAARLLPPPGITCTLSDLFAKIPGHFHFITANPPYIPSAVIPTLTIEVRREPRLSLDGGVDGLDLIRRICTEAKAHLYPGGALLMEADPRQMKRIAEILRAEGYQSITTTPDLTQRPRVISAVFSGGAS